MVMSRREMEEKRQRLRQAKIRQDKERFVESLEAQAAKAGEAEARSLQSIADTTKLSYAFTPAEELQVESADANEPEAVEVTEDASEDVREDEDAVSGVSEGDDAEEEEVAEDVVGSDDDGKDEPVRRKSVSRKATKKNTKVSDARPAQIRDFPRSLLDMCKAHFPGATATDALAAYVLMKSGEVADDIPERIVNLAKHGDDGDKLQSLDDRVRRMEGKLDAIARVDRQTRLLSAYTANHLSGFIKADPIPRSPREIDFLEASEGLFVRLGEQEELQHSRDAADKGRPKRGASKKKSE